MTPPITHLTAPGASPTPQPVATAEHAMVIEAMPLVGHVVRGALARVPSHVDEDDLVAAGLAALVAAAKTYDAARGASFHTYATRRVRGAVIDELRSADWASRSVRRRARELDQLHGRFLAELGREPSDDELAAVLGVGRAEIWKLRADLARAMVMSLDGTTDHLGTEGPAAREGAPVEVLEHRERIAYLRDAVEQLPERLRTVVEGSFFHGRKMTDLAQELGVTESRVSQMRTEALTLLRGALERFLDQDLGESGAGPRPDGAAAVRREAYFAAVSARSSYAQRLTVDAPSAPFSTAN